jgi:hypothetical protein
VLAQAERAILETLEHHANVRLRPVGQTTTTLSGSASTPMSSRGSAE